MTIANETPAPAVKRHVFEHIAPAPYRYLGCSQNMYSPCPGVSQPGGTCDHCGTGIMWEFGFQGADGKKFVVGSSCVEKSGDRGLRLVIAADVKTQQRAVKMARDARNDAEVKALLADATVRATLTAQPHPNAYYASIGKTRLDYSEFMARCSGASGTFALLKTLRPLAPK